MNYRCRQWAAAAGDSRQLVYEHFADTSELWVSVMRHLFERARTATEQVRARRTAGNATGLRRAEKESRAV